MMRTKKVRYPCLSEGILAGKRLQTLIDGRLQRPVSAPPLLCSAETPWSGLPLERDVCYDGGAGTIIFPYTELVMVTAGTIHVDYRALGTGERFTASEGTVTIWPAGHESTPASWTAHHGAGHAAEMIRIQLDDSAFEQLVPSDGHLISQKVAQRSAIQDARLSSLMRLMADEIALGCPGGRLFGEALSLAMQAYVATRYAAHCIESPKDGLAQPVLVRVLDYIRTNLGSDLAIVDLAAVANMSPHHFCLRFKRAVGVTPHQWVTRARIDEAALLLKAGRSSINEVALSVGFTNQSHFTYVFRRLMGTTPKRYRKMS